ncbi:MAG: UDP-N-acetylmuramoyl-L-alanine--D-glutamate ligase [Rikenellaceae bacterium]
MAAKIVILGAGESGCGSAILAKLKGLETFVSDFSSISPKYISLLEQYDIDYEQGGHDFERVLQADKVIKSPGIPDKAPIIKALKEKNIPIISEIEFASEYTSAKTICITGSNGKTTTTTLTYNILRDAGYNVAVGGNIGQSFAYSVATGSYDYYVLELSSFQLDGCYDFRADVAVLMNITPDHLDRYDYQLQNYVDSKFRVAQNQTPEDKLIFCIDDPLTMGSKDKFDVQACQLPFSSKSTQDSGAYVLDGMLNINCCGICMRIDSSKLKIAGMHNHYNVMAASMAALSVGVSPEDIIKSVEAFGGVEHRLESVGCVDGVEYINDSKATNVDSVWYALDSMTKPVVWIAGGTDKGNDYSCLLPLIEGRVKALVCMGLDNKKLVEFFSEHIADVVSTDSLEEAMSKAASLAASGDAVLLSPACASFDLFNNYEHRGEMFKQWVTDYKTK